MSRHLAVRSLPFLATLASACAFDPAEVALDDRLRGDEVYGTPMPAAGRWPMGAATGFNAFILGAAKSFGPGAYLWEGDGVTRAITYRGTTIAKPYSPEKCHCVGATFQVYMTAFEAWDKQYGKSSGSLKGLSVAQVQQLKQVWYVATPALEGSQAALSTLGLGAAVKSLGQAQQGDLAQIWRNNGSGHSVMFDSWVLDAGKIVGINYFSCQGGGPAFVSEVVGTGTKEVDAGRIYVGHPFPPVDVPAEDGGGDTARRDAAPRADGADARRVDVPPGDLALEPRVESQGCGCSSAPSTGSGLVLGLAVVAFLACRRRLKREARSLITPRGRCRCCGSRWRGMGAA